MYQYDVQQFFGASMTLTSTLDGLVFTPGAAVEIVAWGFVITTALSGTPMVVTADKRITAGSDTGRVTGTTALGFGIMSPTAAQITAAVAGTVLINRPTPPATGELAFLVMPGQQLVLKAGTAMGTAGAGLPFVLFRQSPQRPQYTAAMNLAINGTNVKVGLGNEQEVDA